ncbi:MAG: winged helix-turn-helix domain-containing protein [Polyangiaceae bacterium]|jgi:DNA-binding winged helix-turn-helix (wHTH) protein
MRYLFRDIEIDPAAYAIRRRGVLLHVEPRVCELLQYLIEHRDRVVLKSELLREVWRGVSVENAAVDRCISLARKSLVDGTAIRTVRGRGYQWVASVSVLMDRLRPSGSASRSTAEDALPSEAADAEAPPSSASGR